MNKMPNFKLFKIIDELIESRERENPILEELKRMRREMMHSSHECPPSLG